MSKTPLLYVYASLFLKRSCLESLRFVAMLDVDSLEDIEKLLEAALGHLDLLSSLQGRVCVLGCESHPARRNMTAGIKMARR